MMKRSIVSIAIAVSIVMAACGSNSSKFTASATSSTYKVEYTADKSPALGKSAFTLKITRADNGQPAPGLSPKVSPMMDMSGHRTEAMAMGGSSHGAPVGPVTDNGDGTYSCAVYYIMEGSWSLEIMMKGEKAVFPMTVAKNGTDTPMVSFKGVGDMIMGSGGAMTPRPYYMFSEGMEGLDTLMLYVAARQDMFTYPSVHTGQTMGAMTVNSVTFEASEDGVTWEHMMDHGGGLYHAHGLTSMKKGTQGKVYVRMAVNGASCTTDGSPATSANSVQTFMVTP